MEKKAKNSKNGVFENLVSIFDSKVWLEQGLELEIHYFNS